MLSPIVDEISNDLKGRVKVVKINIDENPHTPTKYGVRGIPTLMLFKGGNLTATKVGAMPKAQLAEWVESQL
jgi:thioredoxin 1